MKKNCVNCNTEFEPSRKDKVYCTERCAIVFRSKRRYNRERAKLPPKKCLFCNKDVNRGRKYKYCSDKCHKAMNCKKVCDRARKKVRENHAKKPPKYCKTCNSQLITTVRNYHQLEFCPPCRKQNDREKRLKRNEENKEHLTKYFKRRYALKRNDAEWVNEQNRKVRERRKDPNSQYNSIMNKLTHRIRRNLGMSLKYQGIAKVNQTFKILGFDKHTLREHLESQFTDGMSWDNMGEWHIDHIRPVSSFDYDSTDHPDFKKCWALNNLQPLWAEDNLSKGDKWDGVVNA